MPWGLKRYQQTRELHFITFCCHHRRLLFESKLARNEFILALERVRKWYGFYVVGYVAMPEHVHVLMSEPERGTLALSLQMLKRGSRGNWACTAKNHSGSRDIMISMCGVRGSLARSCAIYIGIQ